jgi:hypothetical protein
MPTDLPDPSYPPSGGLAQDVTVIETPQWKIVASGEETRTSQVDDLVMAWARDQFSKELRYIGELTREQTGAACNCECYSCGLPLQAVNAGKLAYKRRPHFRHPDGAAKDDCLVLSARSAALELLRKDGFLQLPRRRVSAQLAGLSGTYHQAWVEAPSQTVRVSDFRFKDRATAILTLDDGREIRVILDGSVAVKSTPGEGIALTPTIVLSISAPEIAALSPEELRRRLVILSEGAVWCSHWDDEALQQSALDLARAKAIEAMDWLDDGDLPDGVSNEERRETLLHLKAKEILEREKKINLPTLTVTVEKAGPLETPITESRHVFGEVLELDQVTLEKYLGSIRPDVLAQACAGKRWPAGPLIVEITVSNRITEERLARLKGSQIPVLEIDISRMGGRVTEKEFADLVVKETAGKRWLFHPLMVSMEADAEAQVARRQAEQESEARRIKESKAKDRERAALHNIPAALWRDRFLDAVKAYGDELVRLDPTGQQRDRLRAAMAEVERCAEDLAEHGYHEIKDEFILFRKPGNLVQRILSIKEDRPIGYNLNTAWQVINAILQERHPYIEYQSLYLIAIKTYRPTLTEKQLERVNVWRTEVRDSLRSGERTYRRNTGYDRLLSFLFPEMAAGIAVPLGKPAERSPYFNDDTYESPPARLPPQLRNLYLTGPEYERWKAAHPEAAAAWEKAKSENS